MTIEARISSLLREGIEEHQQTVAFWAENTYADLAANCQSPIERLLLAPLMFIWPQCLSPRYEGPGDREREARLYAQYRVGDRKLDFAYIVTPLQEPWEIRLGIECDGHEYHSSVEQKANDNERTIEVVSEQGFNIIRFSGSQISRDPKACAAKVAEAVDGIFQSNVFAYVKRKNTDAYRGMIGPLLSNIAEGDVP